jgi:hypothetical protein
MNEFFRIALNKWPNLVVVGNPVTKKQAEEVIVRTDGLYFYTNENNFLTQLNILLYEVDFFEDEYWTLEKAIARKLKIDKQDYTSIYKYQQSIKDKYRVLDLSYLSNQQIVSCMCGGPYGWMDWNGVIDCDYYNIGKWPSVEAVYEEWQAIAYNFPFLDLKCQLYNVENCEKKDHMPVIQFDISKGNVEMSKPKKALRSSIKRERDMLSSEIGCDLKHLERILKRLAK